MANRTVAVELKAQVSSYVASMKAASGATKQTSEQVLALSAAERRMEQSIGAAGKAVQANGKTLDVSTAAGRANRAALDQIASSTSAYRASLIAAGKSQKEVTEAVSKGRAAWLAAASSMGMSEKRSAALSNALFTARASMASHRAELASFSTGLGMVGLGMVAFAGLAVKSSADFERAMSTIRSTGADAVQNIGDLRQAAIKAGADTQYSAVEAAQAVTELSKAGLSAKNILGGGLTGALALAASGQMQVGDAAEVTAQALAQFQLDGTQASHVADLLAAGAANASGDVNDMSMALNQSGMVARQTGLSIEETVGALAAFANQGLKNSDAGTSLKTMLQRLTPQSAEAAAEFKKLGISAYDSQGKFVGLANFAGQLQTKMGGMSDEARQAAFGVMFGSDAVRAATVLYSEGAVGIQKWINTVNQAGFAAHQAYIMTDNLSGDIERLSGSIDTVFIQSGSGANLVLRQMAQSANVVVDAVGQIPAPLLQIATLLIGGGGIGLAGAAGIMKLGSALLEAKVNMQTLGLSAKTTKMAVAGVGAVLAVGTIALTAWLEAQAAAKANADDFASTMVVVGGKVQFTDQTLSSMNDKLIKGTTGWLGYTSQITELADRAGVSFQDMQGYILGNADAINKVTAAQQRLDSEKGTDPLRSILSQFTITQPFDTQKNSLVAGLDEIKKGMSDGEKQTLKKAEADKAAALGSKSYAEALKKANEAGKDGVSILKAYTDAQFAAADAALKLSGSEIGWQAALDDTTAAIKKNGAARRTASGDLDLNTKKARDNKQQLDQLATSTIAVTSEMMKQGKSEKEISAIMSRTRTQFIKNAQSAGMTGDAAKRLADKYGLIPSTVHTNINVTTSGTGKVTSLQAALTKMQGALKTVNDAFLKSIGGRYAAPWTPGRASGGPIFGAGTETSDSILARLSNNEHVWSADEVRGAGGHASVERMRALARLGDLPQFSQGGAVEPTYKGRALSWWQDKLKSDSEMVRLRIQIRDLKAELKETEKAGKKRRLKLRGLDRTAALLDLRDANSDLVWAVEAQKLNRSGAGTIAARLAESQKQSDAQSDASSKTSDWMRQWMTGSSAADLAANMDAGAAQIADFQNALAGLKSAGLSDQMMSWFTDQGPSAGDLARQVLAGGASSIGMLNTSSGNLAKAADGLGQSIATGKYVPAAPIQRKPAPGYSAPGGSGFTGWGNQKQVVFNLTVSDPNAVAVAVDQKMRQL